MAPSNSWNYGREVFAHIICVTASLRRFFQGQTAEKWQEIRLYWLVGIPTMLFEWSPTPVTNGCSCVDDIRRGETLPRHNAAVTHNTDGEAALLHLVLKPGVTLTALFHADACPHPPPLPLQVRGRELAAAPHFSVVIFSGSVSPRPPPRRRRLSSASDPFLMFGSLKQSASFTSPVPRQATRAA